LTASTRTANTDVAPDGTTTADTITDNIVGNYSAVRQAVTIATGGAQYRGSVYAKKTTGASSFPGMVLAATGGTAKFASLALNTDTGVATARTGEVPDTIAVQDFGTYWRVVWTITTLAANTSLQLEVAAAVNTDASATWSAATQGSAVIWGAMLAPASVDSTYQRITDFTSDFLAAFPTHALYQDAAGTTPVTALGQPVGLTLDKSRGGLNSIGATVTTGAWQNAHTTAFDGFTSASADGFVGTTTGAKSTIRVRVPATLVTGRSYVVSFTISYSNANLGSLNFSDAAYGGVAAIQSPCSALSAVTYQAIGAVPSASGGIMLIVNATGAATVTMTGFSVREVPGVHKIQPTSASREALDARVNLLTYSEQFDNAIWSVQGSTVTANSTVAPDGTTTADTLIETATTEDHNRFQGISAVGGAPYRGSVYLKKGLSDWAALYIVNGTTGNGVRVWFNISTGTVGTSANISSGLAGVSFTIEAAANGYYRCFLTATADGSTSLFRFYVALARSDGGAPSYAGDITYNMAAWGADLRLATDAAYPYQRVVTATDYADVGVPRSFLHDGFDDSSYTASSLNLSGTDKVTVWAGVYKNSDAATGIMYEHSADTNTNDGSFRATIVAGEPRYYFLSKGTAQNGVATGTGFAAPISSVMTGIADIAAPNVAIRVNGVQQVASSASQGAGNYGNHVFYIGRRGNTTLPFNGKIYCIIIRGGVTDAATLALTERYVGSRMGIVL
jgi:hypothetical protein